MTSTPEIEMFSVRARRFVRWTQYVLTVSGVLLLCYVAIALLGAWAYQKHAMVALEKPATTENSPAGARPAHAPGEGDLLGRIEIPRLGIKVAILEGTTSRTLLMGVGHIAGTAFPGQAGNIGIAGHRDTYFRNLKDIRQNDRILLRTARGVVAYEVEWIQITGPDDGAIVSSAPGSALTLVTCYPFHYIGAAPERYIVYARRL